ncbi:MAG: glycosyltransferase family 2 protein [Dysgonamonadaceae bacterium]|nr:glycosyltransferase family 2 protein [Dysgonamonadaceae bacterium]
MKTISVVICTYNRAESLAATLESVARQTFPPEKFEIILVDNNSADSTETVCRRFGQQHRRLAVRYFKEHRQGISYGRNRGVEEACGEWIAFLDDDETVGTDYLQQLDAFYRDCPDAALTGGPVVPVYETPPPEWLSRFTLRLVTGYYNKGERIRTVGAKDYPGTGHATFRRELFLRYGAFNTGLGRQGTSLLGGEDKDFFLRLMRNGVRCYYLPAARVYHHIPAGKLSDEFFTRLTCAIGKSERMRTLSLSKQAYYKRIALELFKWAASLLLFFCYTAAGRFPKGWKLIEFRRNVTKELLKESGS